jgi:hypothetical protein
MTLMLKRDVLLKRARHAQKGPQSPRPRSGFASGRLLHEVAGTTGSRQRHPGHAIELSGGEG